MTHNLVDIDLVFHNKTPRAILVSKSGSESKAVWLPTVGPDPAQYKFINKLTKGIRPWGPACRM